MPDVQAKFAFSSSSLRNDQIPHVALYHALCYHCNFSFYINFSELLQHDDAFQKQRETRLRARSYHEGKKAELRAYETGESSEQRPDREDHPLRQVDPDVAHVSGVFNSHAAELAARASGRAARGSGGSTGAGARNNRAHFFFSSENINNSLANDGPVQNNTVVEGGSTPIYLQCFSTSTRNQARHKFAATAGFVETNLQICRLLNHYKGLLSIGPAGASSYLEKHCGGSSTNGTYALGTAMHHQFVEAEDVLLMEATEEAPDEHATSQTMLYPEEDEEGHDAHESDLKAIARHEKMLQKEALETGMGAVVNTTSASVVAFLNRKREELGTVLHDPQRVFLVLNLELSIAVTLGDQFRCSQALLLLAKLAFDLQLFDVARCLAETVLKGSRDFHPESMGARIVAMAACFFDDRPEQMREHYELAKKTIFIGWNGKHPLGALLAETASRLLIHYGPSAAGRTYGILEAGLANVLHMTDGLFAHPRVAHVLSLQAKVCLHIFLTQCRQHQQQRRKLLLFLTKKKKRLYEMYAARQVQGDEDAAEGMRIMADPDNPPHPTVMAHGSMAATERILEQKRRAKGLPTATQKDAVWNASFEHFNEIKQ